MPAAAPAVEAPRLDPLPRGLSSELRDGGLWLPEETATALDVWRYQAERMPLLCAEALEEQRGLDDTRLRLVVEQQEAARETAVARARVEASGVPVWSVALWVAGALVVGAGGGVVLGLVAR